MLILDLLNVFLVIDIIICGSLCIFYNFRPSSKNCEKITKKTVVFDFGRDLNAIDSEHIDFSYLKEKSSRKKEKHGKKHKKQDTDSEILHLIKKIDKRIKKGYIFENISVEHYERAYKDEILNLYNTSRLSGKTADSVEEILHLLLNNLRKPGESIEEKLETKASVSALNTMLEMDGIKENALDKITSESISDMLDRKV